MRTTADRVRHSLLFEIIGLALCAPLASWILDKAILHVGALSIVLSLAAMLLNYIFNVLFDRALLWLGRPVHVRPVWMRMLHAFLFELSLIILTVPVVASWLDLSPWQAFLTNVGFSLFFLIYAFVYNWIYDRVFPIPTERIALSGKI